MWLIYSKNIKLKENGISFFLALSLGRVAVIAALEAPFVFNVLFSETTPSDYENPHVEYFIRRWLSPIWYTYTYLVKDLRFRRHLDAVMPTATRMKRTRLIYVDQILALENWKLPKIPIRNLPWTSSNLYCYINILKVFSDPVSVLPLRGLNVTQWPVLRKLWHRRWSWE